LRDTRAEPGWRADFGFKGGGGMHAASVTRLFRRAKPSGVRP
jgi:hypothetical protein